MVLPDKITIFKHPMEALAQSRNDLKEQVRHTVWHEVAHFYGLDHIDFHARE
jgi:predicted Zn-dependent protease with MMP-like domain